MLLKSKTFSFTCLSRFSSFRYSTTWNFMPFSKSIFDLPLIKKYFWRYNLVNSFYVSSIAFFTRGTISTYLSTLSQPLTFKNGTHKCLKSIQRKI